VDDRGRPDVGLRGDLLPGWYDDCVLLERERVRQLHMHALEALAEKLAAAGRYGEAVPAAYAAVVAEPLRRCSRLPAPCTGPSASGVPSTPSTRQSMVGSNPLRGRRR
jgi:hypothetical protein